VFQIAGKWLSQRRLLPYFLDEVHRVSVGVINSELARFPTMLDWAVMERGVTLWRYQALL